MRASLLQLCCLIGTDPTTIAHLERAIEESGKTLIDLYTESEITLDWIKELEALREPFNASVFDWYCDEARQPHREPSVGLATDSNESPAVAADMAFLRLVRSIAFTLATERGRELREKVGLRDFLKLTERSVPASLH